jgi:3-oxoacyl-[acyl-carrier protein] reductase
MPDDTRRVAVVTGASSGIGRAAAAELWHRGHHLLLVARREEQLRELAAELRQVGSDQRVEWFVADVSSPAAADAIAAAALERLGPVQVLVNSAGGSRPLELDSRWEDWAAGIELNFLALLRVTHALLPTMIEAGYGRIINVTGGSEPRALNAAGPAKAAVHAWAKGLSCVVAARGVTVNSVAPGRVESEQIQRMHPTDHDRERFSTQNIPMGRFGDAADVARAIAFLAASESGYVTGEVLHVDGGMRRYAF